MELVNTAILRNPVNWFTVLLMLVLFTMLADVILRHHTMLTNALNPHPAAGN